MTAAITVIVCLIFIVLVLLGASLYFYHVGIRRSKKEFLEEDPALIKLDHPWEQEEEWLSSQPLEMLHLQSEDGLPLTGYYIPADHPSERTVILVHGYSSQGKEMGAFAKLYHEMGFHVLMPDNRGHGESGGDYIGFGWPDRRDVMQWIGYLLKRSGKEMQLMLHGVSMGGATVLMTSGEKLPEQVKCIVSDCAYTSVKDILTHQLKQMYRLPPFPLLPITSLVCKLRAGYFFGEGTALKQVAKTHLPVLFIHGDQDTFVPYEMVHRLAAAAGGEHELYVVAGAVHANAYFVDKKEYRDRISRFIGRYMVPATEKAGNHPAV
ncbi:alpha/beta fold hydrolase [Paenibacillus sp. HJL G12]|uniref:Alpha/beta fold hydrolase n=1 Tax=Paenibacillus dendrobii TaxID=2691084 RepID=A0A7X3IMS7_9BACL|nr:alpha/beta hydrolase [Paenibacillus dendrobii]MWV46465.1 alpha/beta fold hydrolase [Paenibacillus dendrobii]